VSILKLLFRLLANDIADIPDIPRIYEGLEMQKQVAGRQMKLASAFRKHMTEGQTYNAPNARRVNFYKQVIELAMEVNFLSFRVL
jgi:hypothetical protein